MPSCSASGEAKIPKWFSRNKGRLGARIPRFWLRQARRTLAAAGVAGALTFGFLAATPASALPVTIAWQVPLSRTESYQLEIARDPGFSKIVHTGTVRGTSYLWDAPEAGVYHWRMDRPGSRSTGGGEASTFVSGSFVAVAPALPQEPGQKASPGRVRWSPVPGADRYKLYLVDARGGTTTLSTTSTSFLVPPLVAPAMLEVVAYTGSRRTRPTYEYDPSLVYEPTHAAPPPPPPPPPVVAAVPPPAPPPTPPPAAAPPPKPVVAPKDPDGDLRQQYLLHVFTLAEVERLRLRKLDITYEDKSTVSGQGAGFWVNPVAGLIVSATGTYHEHVAVVGDEELYPDQKIALRASRPQGDFNLGYNVLDFFGVRHHALTLSVATAVSQLPFLPLETVDADPAVAPKTKKETLTFIGGSGSYAWLGRYGAITLEGGAGVDKDDDATIEWQRATFALYVAEHIALEIGFVNRVTDSARCLDDAELCLKEGKDRSNALERGGFLGVGGVFE